MSTPRLAVLARAFLLLGVFPILSVAQSGDTQQGVKLFEERNLPAARTEFSAVLARNPGDATALFYMGRIAMSDDRSGEAVGWFEKAVKANDRSSEYHFWLGNALGQEAQRASKLRQPFLADASRASSSARRSSTRGTSSPAAG